MFYVKLILEKWAILGSVDNFYVEFDRSTAISMPTMIFEIQPNSFSFYKLIFSDFIGTNTDIFLQKFNE